MRELLLADDEDEPAAAFNLLISRISLCVWIM